MGERTSVSVPSECAVAAVGRIPTIDAARVLSLGDSYFTLEIGYTVKDYESAEPCKKQYEAIYSVSLPELGVRPLGVQPVPDSRKFKSASPSGGLVAFGVERKVGDKTVPVLEIFAEGRLVFSQQIDGEFCTDAFFGRPSWSQLGDLFCFQIEPKRDETGKGTPEYYRECQSWGERLANRTNPRLCLVNWKEQTLEVINVSPDITPASPCIMSDGNVAFVGYEGGPLKYGLVYCYNRPSSVYLWRARTGQAELLCSTPGRSYRSLCLCSGKLYALGNAVGGSHFKASRLYAFTGGVPEELGPDVFTERLQTADGLIFYDELRRSQKQIAIHDPRGEVRRGTAASSTQASHVFLDAHAGMVVAQRSAPNRPHSLVVLRGGQWRDLELHCLDQHSVPRAILDASYTVHQMGEDSDHVLASPVTSNGKLVLLPHGGPNSVYPTEFNILTAMLVGLGYTVAAINYPGSIGFSARGIAALEGRIGELDVECVLETVRTVQAGAPHLKKLLLLGGSHGGYIAAMLTAKYPDTFAGCVMRNPMIDLYSMCLASDIGDWSFGQMGMEFDLSRPKPPTTEQMVKFAARSPALHVANVRTPTVVLVGEKDLRVPPFMGKSWHYWLKANKVDTALYCFPDANHALDTPISEKMNLLIIAEFFGRL